MNESIIDVIYHATFNKTIWKNIIHTKDRPIIYKAFFDLKDGRRVYLNKQYPCNIDEIKTHSHPNTVEFLLLSGKYKEFVYCTKSEEPLIEIVHLQGSWRKIDNEKTSHAIQPLKTSYSIMIVNDQPKDAEFMIKNMDGYIKMGNEQMDNYLHKFRLLISSLFITSQDRSCGEGSLDFTNWLRE